MSELVARLCFLCFFAHFLGLRPSGYASLSSRNCKLLLCFSWDYFYFWLVHDPTELSLPSSKIHFSGHGNKQLLLLLFLCSCESALSNSVDAVVLLMLMSVKAELRSPSPWDGQWRWAQLMLMAVWVQPLMWELDSVILGVPFQLRIFCDIRHSSSVESGYTLGESKNLDNCNTQ